MRRARRTAPYDDDTDQEEPEMLANKQDVATSKRPKRARRGSASSVDDSSRSSRDTTDTAWLASPDLLGGCNGTPQLLPQAPVLQPADAVLFMWSERGALCGAPCGAPATLGGSWNPMTPLMMPFAEDETRFEAGWLELEHSDGAYGGPGNSEFTPQHGSSIDTRSESDDDRWHNSAEWCGHMDIGAVLAGDGRSPLW